MVRKVAVASVCFLGLAWGAALQTPEQFAGFRIGSDKNLVRWDRIVEYMRQAAAASPRVKFEELGKTTNGHPFIAVTLSAADTIPQLAQYRDAQRRLVYARDLSADAARKLIERQRAVVLITCNIHSTEIGASQMALELVYRLATEDSPTVRKILDNVILVLVPSLNPDGQILVTDHYRLNLGTKFERSFLPELYHKYTGHDNNRDAFMNTQVESRLINRLTYKDWFPHVFFDEHQMGSLGARIFVPPFKNPINLNVDPVIWELNGLFGYTMGTALHARNYTGIITDAMYTSWWQGGFLMQAWWHNMVGLLTEVASVNVASPINQQQAKLGETPRAPELTPEELREADPGRTLPAPRDVTPRNTYPRPWLGGKWTLRDIVDYELTATFAALEAAANNREMVVRSVYEMNRRQIERGAKEAPYAWVIPAAQHDPPAAARLAQILDELGVEVHQATAEFEAGGKKYGAGSYVVQMAQPYRAFAKDLLEKQIYPPYRPAPEAPPERPYDVTGWTLPLQMGVDAVEIPARFEAKLELRHDIPIPAGRFQSAAKAAGYEISHAANNSILLANRLLKASYEVSWNAAGNFFVREKAGLKAALEKGARELGVDVTSAAALPAPLRRLKSPRVGLYRSWVPNMDEGWTRWLLEQYEFAYTSLRHTDIQAGDLNARLDAIILPAAPKISLLRGATQTWVRPEHRGGLDVAGVAALKAFVRNGGTLVALGNASLLPVEEFPLPLKNAFRDLKPGMFSCPGSLLKIFVDNTMPEGFGMPETASAVFYNNVAFEPTPPIGASVVRVLAKYPGANILDSGWIMGEEHLRDRIAAAEVTLGKGRVVLLGFAAQNRAQPLGTFKLFFNSLHLAGAE